MYLPIVVMVSVVTLFCAPPAILMLNALKSNESKFVQTRFTIVTLVRHVMQATRQS